MITEEQLKEYLSTTYQLSNLKVTALGQDIFEVLYVKDFTFDPIYFTDVNGKEVLSEHASLILILCEMLKINGTDLVNTTKPEEFVLSTTTDLSNSDDVAIKNNKFTSETFLRKQIDDNLHLTIQNVELNQVTK